MRRALAAEQARLDELRDEAGRSEREVERLRRRLEWLERRERGGRRGLNVGNSHWSVDRADSSNRLGRSLAGSLIRNPPRRPRRTVTASSLPRWIQSSTVCRDTPSRAVAICIATYPSGASATKRWRNSLVRRIRQGAPGVI